MLDHFSITNYLLIDRVELDLAKGFTAMTGSTGSGKSIVLGALGLAIGDRAESGVHRDPNARCIVELTVDINSLDLKEWFGSEALPWERKTILRRQIESNGRSRAFVNDTPVRLEQLRELGDRIVHIHSQHETRFLNDRSFQLHLVDALCASKELLGEYRRSYTTWKAEAERLAVLVEEERKAQSELDYLRFQLKELEEADLQADEQATLEEDLQRAEHAQEIKGSLERIQEDLVGDRGQVPTLKTIEHLLDRTARLDPQLAPLHERLISVRIELKDIGEEVANLASAVNTDPNSAERLRDRLDMILRLQQKHRVDSVEALIGLRDELRERTGHIDSLSGTIETLNKNVAALEQDMRDRSVALSKARKQAIPALEENVTSSLGELGMPQAVVRVEHRTVDPGPQGIDAVELRFSANADRDPEPVEKVASGGELGRLMFALIGLTAGSSGLPTVVFDEIDTGVSGDVAHKVGEAMARMGKQRQVIAITHLPQVASKAHTHVHVEKRMEGSTTRTDVTVLDEEARLRTIAGMLSGKRTSKAALDNAKVLLSGK